MTPPLEHDYIGGLAVASSGQKPGDKVSSPAGDGGEAAADLKGTELRLGLPDSGPGECVGLTLGPTPPKSGFPSAGAKRGFSVAIDGGEKWCLSGGRGSDVELEKSGALFPMGDGKGAAKPSGTHAGLAKDGGPAAKAAPATKAQVVGWPPIRSYRKNTMATNPSKNKEDAAVKQGSECLYIKVSMDGAPYLRKIDLKTYCNYKELLLALEKMFNYFTISGHCGPNGTPGREELTESRMMNLLQGSEYVVTYEDKDGDWMLVGDVPWDMFTDSCRRLRIMKGSDAIGFAPRSMDKSKGWN